MKYSAEYAVFHAAFQLFEKEVLSANLDLENLSKNDCRRFIHIISAAVEEISQGLEKKNYSFTQQHWHFNLHLVVFLKLFSQENLENTIDKLSSKLSCPDDLLVIVAPLPHVSHTFYFELLKTCSWNLLFIECLSALNPEEITKLFVPAIRHCEESPQSADDLFLLASLIQMINITCFPQKIQEFCLKQRKITEIHMHVTGRPFCINNIRQMLNDDNQILSDLLDGMERLLNSAIEEAEMMNSSFWNCEKKISRFPEICVGLTLLGITLYKNPLDIAVTFKHLCVTEVLQILDKGQLSNVDKNMKKWLQDGKDVDSLKRLHAMLTKYVMFEDELCQLREDHFQNFDLKYLPRIISSLFLSCKVLSISCRKTILENRTFLSTLKFFILCEMFLNESHLYLFNRKSSSCWSDTVEGPEKDFIDQMDFILDRIKMCFETSLEEPFDRPSDEENILPEDKLAKMLKDENLGSWKDYRFLLFLKDHQRELSNSDLFPCFWERINWLAQIPGEKDLAEEYLKILLNSYSLLDPFLQDYLIRDFYLPIKCEENRPWWRQSSRFQQKLAVSLNKLTEKNFSKIPKDISQYALLDFETVLRTSVFLAINNACQVDVIVQLLMFLPVSCQITCPQNGTDHEETRDGRKLTLLAEVMESVLNSGKLNANQENAFLDLMTHLIKPVFTGVRKQFGVKKYSIHWHSIFSFHILPRLHLILTKEGDQSDTMFIVRLLLVVLESEQMHESSCTGEINLHVVLVQICHALNDSVENWENGKKRREISWKLKPLLISAANLLEEILLKNLPPDPDKILKWLTVKLSILDWTVQLRLRKSLFFISQNPQTNLQLNHEIVSTFLKSHEITQTCDVQQTIHLLQLTSIDEELCSSVIEVLPSYILFSRDCVTVAFSQLLPNLLPTEGILICRFLMHLLENNQLIVPCHTGFLPSIPFLNLSVLKSYVGLLQLFLDVVLLQVGLETSIAQFVFDNIFAMIKTFLLSSEVLSKIHPMLVLLLIHQIFSVMNILLNVVSFLNMEKIQLFLVELIKIFSQHTFTFHPMKKKRNKNDEIENSGDQTVEFNLSERTLVAEVDPRNMTSENVTVSSPPDKFHIALALELLTSMTDQVNQLSSCEIKKSIFLKLDEMKQPFLKICKKIQ